MIHRFDYQENGSPYRHSFVFDDAVPGRVDIHTHFLYDPPGAGYHAWIHQIKDGQIVWRVDDFLHLSTGAMVYGNRLVKLLVFL
jgi:hypothetical protein